MWTLLLIFPLLSDPEPELIFSRPGAVLPIQAVEQNIGIEVCLNSGLATPLSELRAPENGRHLVSMIARDQLGNVSQAKWYLLQVDAEPPSLSLSFSNLLVSGEDGKRWVPPATETTLQVQDDQSGLANAGLSINGETYPATGPLTVPLTGQGEIQIVANAEDAVGNVTPPLRETIYLDDAPPSGKLTLIGLQKIVDGTLVVGPKLRVEGQLQDAESGLAHWTPILNGAPVEPSRWHGPWAAGTYSVTAQAEDKVGNRTELKPVTFEVDTQPPKVTAKVNSETFTNASGKTFVALPLTLTASAMDDRFGACTLEYYRPEFGWRTLEGSIDLELPILEIRSRDPVGNEMRDTLSWPVDRQPPEIRIRDVAKRELDAGVTHHLTIGDELFPEIIDQGAGLAKAEFRMGDEPFRPVPDWFRFRKKDQFQLTLRATDHLGNQTTVSYAIQVGHSRKSEQP